MAKARTIRWVSDEWIVALDFYLRHRGRTIPDSASAKIKALSKRLRGLNIHNETLRSMEKHEQEVFRNAVGAYRQVKLIEALDPEYKKKGSRSKSSRAIEVWHKYHDKPELVSAMADNIIALAGNIDGARTLEAERPFGAEFAIEGKLLSFGHWKRERNTSLVKRKKESFLTRY